MKSLPLSPKKNYRFLRALLVCCRLMLYFVVLIAHNNVCCWCLRWLYVRDLGQTTLCALLQIIRPTIWCNACLSLKLCLVVLACHLQAQNTGNEHASTAPSQKRQQHTQIHTHTCVYELISMWWEPAIEYRYSEKCDAIYCRATYDDDESNAQFTHNNTGGELRCSTLRRCTPQTHDARIAHACENARHSHYNMCDTHTRTRSPQP